MARESLSRDMNYVLHGVDALYTPPNGSPVTIRVIDKTRGVAVLDANTPGVETVLPAAHVKLEDVGTAPERGTLQIPVDGQVWKIDVSRLLRADERQLLLSKVA